MNFLLDLLDIEWSQILNVQNNDVNASFIAFEKKINELLDLYLPLKKMTKRELKQQQKPWMKRRDRLLKKFTKAKHELIKIQYHKECKKLRNQIVALCRINKKNYYQNFFTENANNLKKTWQGIKSIININSNNKSQPSSLPTEERIIN